MDNSDEYWRRARAAYQQAKQATSEKDKATWYRIAESFETLYRLAPRNDALAVRNTDTDLEDSRRLLH